MKLIKNDTVLIDYNEAKDELTVFAEFSKVKWKKKHFIHLSTFFARAENDFLLSGKGNTEPLPDIVF